jgi:hypothetical protein
MGSARAMVVGAAMRADEDDVDVEAFEDEVGADDVAADDVDADDVDADDANGVNAEAFDADEVGADTVDTVVDDDDFGADEVADDVGTVEDDDDFAAVDVEADDVDETPVEAGDVADAFAAFAGAGALPHWPRSVAICASTLARLDAPGSAARKRSKYMSASGQCSSRRCACAMFCKYADAGYSRYASSNCAMASANWPAAYAALPFS